MVTRWAGLLWLCQSYADGGYNQGKQQGGDRGKEMVETVTEAVYKAAAVVKGFNKDDLIKVSPRHWGFYTLPVRLRNAWIPRLS